MSSLGRRRGRIPPSRVESKYFPMEGGLNLTDPVLNLRAGECLAGINHEPAIPRGYRRVEGFERIDGQPSPSAAQYWLVSFKAGTVEIPIGSEITSEDAVSSPSLITARTITLPVVLSGSFAGNDAVGYVIVVEMAYAGTDTEFTLEDTYTYSTGLPWATISAVERESGVDNSIVTDTTLPSDGYYIALSFYAGTDEPSVGDLIKGQTSNTEGTLVSIPIVTSGSWAGNDAAGFYIIINFGNQDYAADETLIISPAAVGGVALPNATATAKGEVYNDINSCIYFHYLHMSQEDRRSVITAVPGQGPVRGVWMFNGERYAFRDKVAPDDAYAGMYKATATGWAEQTFNYQLGFVNSDTLIVADGTTIVIGATSGAAGTVERVIKMEGAWSASDRTQGELVISGVTGTFQCGEDIIIGSAVVGQAGGVQYAQTLAAGGHYDFDNHNFYATAAYKRMYFVSGTDNACEWDGSILAKITTGMDVDKPVHVRAYNFQLFLAFPGGSLQPSSLGEPLTFNALSGAAEIGVGDDITGLVVESDNVLTVFSRNRTNMLYGSSSADWELKPYHENMGAIEWSVQKIGQSWFLDDRGLTTLTATQQYGDFKQNSVSTKVDPFLQPRMAGVRCSQISRTKNQYRIFFDDGYALFGTFEGRKVLGFLPIQYGVQPYCSESVEDADGYEELLMGCDDGFVYKQDIGTSFDGESISATLMLNYYHYETPTYNKRFRGVTFEMNITDNTDVLFLPDFSYGSDEVPRADEQQNLVVGGGGLWDYALWDQFLWSGQVISTGRNRIDGVGANMGLMFFSDSKYLQSYTIQGATVAYSIRRLVR